MALKEALLAVALGFPAPWYEPGKNPETPDEYRARLEIIAEAIALEATGADAWPHGAEGLASATLVLWQAESRLSYDIHANTGNDPWGQDYGRARCLGQLHATGLVPQSEWETLAGSDLAATRRCANATMRVLRAQYWVCKSRAGAGDPIARMFEVYATGRSCNPGRRSHMRTQRYQRVLQQIYTERARRQAAEAQASETDAAEREAIEASADPKRG